MVKKQKGQKCGEMFVGICTVKLIMQRSDETLCSYSIRVGVVSDVNSKGKRVMIRQQCVEKIKKVINQHADRFEKLGRVVGYSSNLKTLECDVLEFFTAKDFEDE